MFVESWEEIDVNGSGYISAADLTSVLLQVSPPLGVKGVPHATARIQQMLQDADIPLR
jgi:Ca2+-binding EF-hand superfamily protein